MTVLWRRPFRLLVAATYIARYCVHSFQVAPVRQQQQQAFKTGPACLRVEPNNDKDNGGVQEYRNAATSFLSNFLPNASPTSAKDKQENPLSKIDFDAPKTPILDLQILAQTLDAELFEREWFVTGNVNPIYFADSFEFQDPDVKLQGIEDYAKGVYKLFDQETTRAEIISTVVNTPSTTVPNTITVTWRLSGKVNIGPGLVIKPYICYTDFTVQDWLVVFQEDRFDIPGWDILLSALFPFLIGKVTAPPAPPVEPRPPPAMPRTAPSLSLPFDALAKLFQL